jgi:MFS family permease
VLTFLSQLTSIAANQEITPNHARPLAFGINQTMGSSMAILGTFVAAAFVEHNTGGHGGWPWAYYFNAIVYAITGVAVFVTYFPPPPLLRRQGQLKDIISHADYIGILLLCGSLASLLIGLTWGGTTYPWSSGKIIATLTSGCVGLVIFGLWEWLGKSDGLFDHRLLKTANFPILLFVCLIDGMLLLGVNVLYAQEIADLFTTNAIHIAVILCPYLITSTFGCFPAGFVMARTKSYRILLVGALLWCSLFTGLMALINPNRLAMACVFSALFGIATAVTTVIPSKGFSSLNLSSEIANRCLSCCTYTLNSIFPPRHRRNHQRQHPCPWRYYRHHHLYLDL